MTKPYIKYTPHSSGDWVTLDVNYGEDFHFEGHSIPYFKWIELIEMLGFKVDVVEWFSVDEKMPQVGDHIIVSDGYDEMEIFVSSLPQTPYNGNVIMWRYADE